MPDKQEELRLAVRRQVHEFEARVLAVIARAKSAADAKKGIGEACNTFQQKVGKLKVNPPPQSNRVRAAKTSQSNKLKVDQTLKVDVGSSGAVVYGNGQDWEFRFGTTVEWVSDTGAFTIALDGFDELPSPFTQDGQSRREMRSSKSGAQWVVGPVEVLPVWTPAQLSGARASGAYYQYIVAIQDPKSGKLILDRTQSGRPDC